MAKVTVQRYDGPEATRRLGAFLPAYREIYAELPYRARRTSWTSPRCSPSSPSGRASASRWPGTRARVVGFAYGFCLPPETGWWRNLLTLAPAEFTAEDGQRTFAVIELAVRRPWRRQGMGIARRLHAAR